mmetsp:Transcript_19135/g.45072  ORF Transcript_19135/g.45072 Transcript_19135/m.45072 type:complete len:193 (-) Transcript_19135:143-721(-)
MERTRNHPEISDELHEHCHMLNPYAGNGPFFARGLSHMYFNSSAKTRLLISPHTDDPLTSKRHHSHILASRNFNMERLPPFLSPPEQPAVPVEAGGEGQTAVSESSAVLESPSRAEQSNSARGPGHCRGVRPSSQYPPHSARTAARAYSLAASQAATQEFRATRRERTTLPKSRRQLDLRKANYGKMVLPLP